MDVRSRRARRAAVLTALAAGAVLPACVPPPNIVPGNPGTVDVLFEIDTSADVQGISPFIYGSNVARDLGSNRLTFLRQGGNRWTAYNWETNASNAGSDWCHQNDSLLSSSNTPGAAVRPGVEQARNNGAAALVTVPIVDHVAADKNGGSNPPDCSGDVAKSGPNYLTTRFKGNVADKPGALSTTPNSGDGVVYQEEFVHWLESTLPDANIMYSLDNEPDLWSGTHARIHPTNVGYAEIVERNTRYAKAIKSVAPDAKVFGPVSYGFYGFERLQDAPDHGGRNFLDYYLQQMRAAETANGKRLVDALDLHWYPEAQGGGQRIVGGDNSAAVAAARVQAPRSLWDPTYTESSWITNDYGYGPIRLIPRTQDRIDAHYPGTGMAFTEWNYGGGNHISGAIAVADVLGVFGREGVVAANYWEMSDNESFAYAGFRAFRNYDGAGGSFGDRSVRATTSNVSTATVYASTTSTLPRRTVIIAINKSTSARTAGFKVASPTRFTTADVWRLTSAGPNLTAQPDLAEVATNAFRTTLPPMSVTVIVPTAG
jgi:hypothetical protein